MDVTSGTSRLATVQVTRGGQTVDEAVAHDGRGNLVQLGHLTLRSGWMDNPDHVDIAGGATDDHRYAHDGRRARTLSHAADGRLLRDRRYIGSATLTTSDIAEEAATDVALQLVGRIAVVYERPSGGGPGRTRHQVCDHLGSPTIELDDQGTLLTYEELHPHGTTAYSAQRESAQRAKRFRFAGCERDPSGLQVHGLRFYAVWVCRFTSPDPVGLQSGDPCAYRYAMGNPVMRQDRGGAAPSGPSIGYVEDLAKSYATRGVKFASSDGKRAIGDIMQYSKFKRGFKASYATAEAAVRRLTRFRLNEAEHFFGIGIKEFFRDYVYSKAPARVYERAVSVLKTVRPGGDNALTAAAKEGLLTKEQFIASSRGNLVRSLGDTWAQLGRGTKWLKGELQAAETFEKVTVGYLEHRAADVVHLETGAAAAIKFLAPKAAAPAEKAVAAKVVTAVAPKLGAKAGSKIPVLGIAVAAPLVAMDIKKKDWGNAYLDAVGPVPVAGWVAAGAQVVLSSETAKLAIGTTIVEKMIGAHKDDVELLDKMTAKDVVVGAAGGIAQAATGAFHSVFGR